MPHLMLSTRIRVSEDEEEREKLASEGRRAEGDKGRQRGRERVVDVLR